MLGGGPADLAGHGAALGEADAAVRRCLRRAWGPRPGRGCGGRCSDGGRRMPPGRGRSAIPQESSGRCSGLREERAGWCLKESSVEPRGPVARAQQSVQEPPASSTRRDASPSAAGRREQRASCAEDAERLTFGGRSALLAPGMKQSGCGMPVRGNGQTGGSGELAEGLHQRNGERGRRKWRRGIQGSLGDREPARVRERRRPSRATRRKRVARRIRRRWRRMNMGLGWRQETAFVKCSLTGRDWRTGCVTGSWTEYGGETPRPAEQKRSGGTPRGSAA